MNSEASSMLLYSPHITPRLRYITEFIGMELFAQPIGLTSNREEFMASGQPGINYSKEELGGAEFFLEPASLLFESYIRRQEIECFELNYHKAFFQTRGDFPFDILAASFYLISRYEEYLPHPRDEYGRYPYRESLAHREGFLQLPLVNIWIHEVRLALERKFPALVFRRPAFGFIPTYDIDIAYSFLHKGAYRNAGALARLFLKGRFRAALQRIQVLRGRRADPFDAYEWLDSLHLYCRMKAQYFFLVAREQKGVDRNISPSKKGMQDLVRYHASGYTIGLHPSWQSGDQEKLLDEELEWLSRISERKISSSRQHYIRMDLPQTYRRLLKAGIEKDFSMGYGSINGFRASVASSFFWFDLEKGEQTPLQVFPFCFMDANSYYEQKYTPRQALDELMQYYQSVKRVNGLMITIWHNHFLGTDPQFEGWKEVYELFLKEEVYWDM